MIILIQEYHESKNKERQNEIRETLNKNLSNKYIDKIYLLNEQEHKYLQDLDSLKDSGKLNVIVTGKRLAFVDIFEYIKNNINDPENIIIISNNDIYFEDSPDDHMLQNSFENINNVFLDNPKTVIALSRSETISKYSQDAWIFKAPINIKRPLDYNFYFGILGVDNRIAYLLKEHDNFVLRNLPKDIVIVHNHKSNHRTYNSIKVPGPHTEVDPQEIKKPIMKFGNTVIMTFSSIK